ncbi:MAG TPA: glycosyltransferase family 39 protein, partial [Vicinamibacteria bacterium]
MERRALWIVLGFALTVGAVAGWLLSSTPGGVRETLRILSPRVLEIAFLLMVAGASLSFPTIRDSLPSRSFFYPLLIGLLAFAAVRVIPPRTHRIYYDEDIYESVAQNILWTGRAQMCNEGTIEADTFRCDASEYNKEPNAFPVLLSLSFRITGVSETMAHAVNHAVFALGAVAVFWVAGMLFGQASAGLGAALVYTLTPQNLLWGATAAAEPGAASFAVFGIGAFLLFTRTPSWRSGLFAASALAFASQFRPESGLVVVAAGLAVLLLAPNLLKSRALWATALLTLVLLVPQIAHIWAVRHEKWGSGDTGKFSLAYVSGNAGTNVDYYT